MPILFHLLVWGILASYLTPLCQWMTTLVKRRSKSACISLRNIGRVRKHLNKDTSELLIHAFVSSRLDMGNSLLYGVTNLQLSQLQRIQNMAARIVTLTKTREHITPVLFDLHWLPVRQRTMYKLGLFVYKILNDLAPCYLTDLIELYAPGRSGLRSSNHWGERSFRFAAATLWNPFPSDVCLSPSLPSFKNNFKTFLFKDAFELYLWTCIVILLCIYLFPLWLLYLQSAPSVIKLTDTSALYKFTLLLLLLLLLHVHNSADWMWIFATDICKSAFSVKW